MIYLLEGPDGTGKTTFAKYLVNKAIEEKRTCLYFHCTNTSSKYKSPDEGYSILLEDLKHYKELDYDIVLDRAWISNIIYTKVFEPVKDRVSEFLCKELLKVTDRPIICLPKDRSKYLQRFEELRQTREEAYNSMEKIYDEFDKFAKDCFRYDFFDHMQPGEPYQAVADFLSKLQSEGKDDK